MSRIYPSPSAEHTRRYNKEDSSIIKNSHQYKDYLSRHPDTAKVLATKSKVNKAINKLKQ